MAKRVVIASSSRADGRSILTEFGPQAIGQENLGADPAAPQNGYRIFPRNGGLFAINPAGTVRALTPKHMGGSVSDTVRYAIAEENYVQTLNATPVALLEFQMPTNSVAIINGQFWARQRSGTVAGDSAIYIYNAGVKRHGSGSGAEITANTPFVNENVAAWNVTLTHVATGLMRFSVVGDATDAVDWWGKQLVEIFQTLT